MSSGHRAAVLAAASLLAGACASAAPAVPVPVAEAPVAPRAPDPAAATAGATELRRLTRELTAAVQREDFREAERLAKAVDAAAGDLARNAEGDGGPAPKFRILEAQWGMGTRWSDVTAKARSRATPEGLSSWVDQHVWGDPAPHWKKTLIVVYLDRGAVRTAVVAEDRAIRIP